MKSAVRNLLLGFLVTFVFAVPIQAAKITIEKPPIFSADGDYIGHEEIDPLLLDQLRFTVIAEYETYVVGEVEEPDLKKFQTTATTRGMSHEVRRDFDEVRVNKYSFSSFGQPADLPRGLTIDRYDGPTGLFLVQLKAPLTTEWHNALTRTGDIIGYLPENTFIIRGVADADVGLAGLPGVQHVSIHQPAFKVRRTILTPGENITVDIQFDGEQDLAGVSALLRTQTSQEVRIEIGNPFSYTRMTLSQEGIALLAQRPEVLWIDRALPIEFSGERQATITAGLHDLNGVRPARYIPDGHHGWLLSKDFCTPTEAPDGCNPYWTKVGVIDSGLDRTICDSGYDEYSGECTSWSGSNLLHPDLNHRSNVQSTPSKPGPCVSASLGPEASGDCDDPIVRERWFCAADTTGTNQCYESGTEYDFSDIVHDSPWYDHWFPGHGTGTTSIIAGDPLSIAVGDPNPPDDDDEGFLRGSGVAPSAQIVVGSFVDYDETGDPGMDPGKYEELIGKVFRLGGSNCNMRYVRFANNSWNMRNYIETPDVTEVPEAYEYTAYSQMADRLVRDGCLGFDNPSSDMTIVFSAGNHQTFGLGSWVTSPANAKNVISVGASRGWSETTSVPHPRCQNNDGIHVISDVAGGASIFVPPGLDWHSRRGYINETGGGNDLPRFKPDLVAPGTQCVGARSSYFGTDPTHGGWNRCFYGTSAAAPAITGASVLADAWYWYKISGETAVPSPAMIRAMLVAHADDLQEGMDWITDPDPPTALPHSPSIAQGWGRVNLDKLFHKDQIPELVWDQDHRTASEADRRFTSSGQFWKTKLQINDSSKDIVAVLVYTDRFASLSATDLTVNNLDLNIFTNDFVQGKSFWGNRFDVASEYSKEFGGATFFYPGDTVNTVEVIRIESGELTEPFWIRVGARNVSGKAVPGLDGGNPNQDFALYVYNVEEAP